MSFAAPWLLLLLAVPAAGLAAYLAAQRRPPRHAIAFPNLEVLAAVVEERGGWRRHLPAVLLALALSALVLTVARPSAATMQVRSGSTVVLVVDVSGSMRATDVKPTRLDAALRAMLTFVDRSPKGLRIGVVAFSSEANVITALSSDKELVREGIRSIVLGGRTAIGDALARAVALARSTPEADGADGSSAPAPTPAGGAKAATAALPPAAIVLLSDGAQTAGSFSPDEGAAMAKAAVVRVSTVALGTPGGTLDPRDLPSGGFGGGFGPGGGGFGGRIPVPPDPVTLGRIAAATGGKGFTAQSAGTLQSIYAGLGRSVERVKARDEVSWIPLAIAAALLAAFAATAVARAPRLP